MMMLFQKNRIKKYFYFVCFFILCICDQRIGSAAGEIQLVSPNIALIVLSCIALSHYPFSDFRRPFFWISAMVFTAGACLALYLLWPGTVYHYQLISGALAGVLYSCVVIQTARVIISERRLPGGSHLGIWLLGMLLVLMLLSRHDKYNGPLLCLSILLIFLTDFTAQERDWMLRSLAGAVLTAFFVFQGLALVFRPFDSGRYLGLYANPNINALFYQIVYCVFLGIFCILETKRRHSVLKWINFCLACAMWSFVMLTMCRSAALGMTAATVLGFFVVLWKRREMWVRRTLLYVCSLLLGCVISFPVVYGAVRYLPAVFHHPVWFEGEYSEWKVHSWDPYDSEKYTDWRDVIQGNFGRFFPDAVNVDLFPRETSQAAMFTWAFADCRKDGMPCSLLQDISISKEEFRVFSGAVEEKNRKVLNSAGNQDERRLVTESVEKWKTPALKTAPETCISNGLGAYSVADMNSGAEERPSVMRGSIEARFGIYRHYLSGLNLWGHKDSENGFQYSESYYAPHAHNIFLQYAFNYGLPAGIVFLVYVAASGIRLLTLCMRDESGMPFLLGLLLFAAIAAFGMTEIVWRYGQLAHTLLLLLPCFVWQHMDAAFDKAE